MLWRSIYFGGRAHTRRLSGIFLALPSGARSLTGSPTTASAVGCTLSPLRGWDCWRYFLCDPGRYGLARRLDLSRGCCFQLMKLLYMMQAVHEVELAPLRCGKGTEDGVVEKFAAGAKVLLAACNDLIHLGNLRANFGEHFFRGNSARTSDGWGFPAGGQMAESYHDEGSSALRPGLRGR